jgi:protein O-GlcNAc transferase
MTESGKAATAAVLRQALADHDAGRTAEAEAGFRQVLVNDPDNGQALYFLSVLAYQSNRPVVAVRFAEKAVVVLPQEPDCHNLLGVILLALKRPDEAERALRTALQLDPGFAGAANNLGAALEAQGRPADATVAYRQALEIEPRYAEAACNLGRALLRLGRPAESAEMSSKSLGLHPGLRDAQINLAVAQQRLGQFAEAEETLNTALAADRGNAILHRYLGVLWRMRGDLTGAEGALRQSLLLDNSPGETHDNLAAVLLDQGRAEAAEASFYRALQRDGGNQRTHSNLLLCLNYRVNDRSALFRAHRAWAERHARPIAPMPPDYRPRDHDRLRIGYLSADFRRHSVAFFFEPLLTHLDRSRFECWCYASMENPDAVTERLMAASDHWRWVAGMDDAQLAAQIRADEIDILVDLSGHTAGNRLLAMQRRPAFVQATWLGYPNTTGMTAVDFRITDDIADSPDTAVFSTEKLAPVKDGFLCYQPPSNLPPVAPLPAASRGHVTFGSFNNLRKVTPAVIAAWARLLSQVPDSRLLLKARALGDVPTAQRYLDMFSRHGVDASRVELRGPVAETAGHLESYRDVDIALDPFPYNGTTTSCEALLMGVPVLTLHGNRHAARVGTSLLTRVGLTDWIAQSIDGYVVLSAEKASDIDGLSQLRSTLRGKLLESPLCDAPGFAARMGAVYERMWRGWNAGDAG